MPRSFIFVLTLLTLSLTLNVTLGWKLKERTPARQINKEGLKVKSFEVATLSGSKSTLSFSGGRPTLLYFIDPQCHWCEANAASFNALPTKEDETTNIVLLTSQTKKMEQFLAHLHPRRNVLVVRSPEIIKTFGFTGTPQTFVVNTHGRIEHHWVGAYIGKTRSEIEKTFNMKLPEVTPPA